MRATVIPSSGSMKFGTFLGRDGNTRMSSGTCLDGARANDMHSRRLVFMRERELACHRRQACVPARCRE